MCRRVLLPAPEAPRMAAVSPSRSSRSSPDRTTMSRPPLEKALSTPRMESTVAAVSLIAEDLHRIEAGRLPRGVESREHGHTHGGEADDGDVERLHPHLD